MLVGTHYQNGYVCDDIDEAIALFQARGLDKDPMVIPVDHLIDTPNGLKKQVQKITMFWLNGLQYELIQPIIDEANVYANAPSNANSPLDRNPIRFHHICLRVPEWEPFRAAVGHQDFPVVMERGDDPDKLRFLYLDARKVFGHYLEYTCMSDAMWEQLKGM